MAETTQNQYAAIVDAYRTRLHDRHIHLSPGIPPKKLRSAIESYAPGVDEAEVLALVDSTVMGSAKDGGLLTRTALHGHEVDGQPVKVLLRDIHVLATDQRPTGTVVLADGRRVFSGGVASFDKVEIFVDLARDVARRAGAATLPSQRAPVGAREPRPAHRSGGPAPSTSPTRVEVPIELYHLVRGEWRRNAVSRTVTGVVTKYGLVVPRPHDGRACEQRHCPRCGARLEIRVYSRQLLRRYLMAGGAMSAAGLAVLALIWLRQDNWLDAETRTLQVLGAVLAVASVALVLVGGGLVWWARWLERCQGVRHGEVGKDGRFEDSFASHSVALRS